MRAKRRVYVKPVAAGGLFGWTVLELTPVESFIDDWRRYGVRVALSNVWVEITTHA